MAFRISRLLPLLAAALAATLSACTTAGEPSDQMMAERKVAGPELDSFTMCHGYGCRLHSRIGLSTRDWAPVASLFAVPSADAEAERARIATAIGLIETAVGRKTGTSVDVGGTFNGGTGSNFQLDCYDEATNTVVYLTLLNEAGYLKWHRVKGWAGRGVLIDGEWPHETAVIVERKTGKAYAVDSWFEDNGHAAHVVPLDQWLAGWRPPGFHDSLL